ncbi:hypothetical protein PA6761_04327 [Pseudomonas aeruginosa]
MASTCRWAPRPEPRPRHSTHAARAPACPWQPRLRAPRSQPSGSRHGLVDLGGRQCDRCPPSLHLLQTGRGDHRPGRRRGKRQADLRLRYRQPRCAARRAALGDGRGHRGGWRLQRPPGQLSAIHPRPVAGRAHRLRGAAHHQHRARPAGNADLALCPALLRDAPGDRRGEGGRLPLPRGAGRGKRQRLATDGRRRVGRLHEYRRDHRLRQPGLGAERRRQHPAAARRAAGTGVRAAGRRFLHRGAGTGGSSLSLAARRGSAPGARPGPGSRRDCGCCPSFPT